MHASHEVEVMVLHVRRNLRERHSQISLIVVLTSIESCQHGIPVSLTRCLTVSLAMHWLRIYALSGQIVEAGSMALHLWVHRLTGTQPLLDHILRVALVEGHSLFTAGATFHFLLSSFEGFDDLELLLESLVLQSQ